MRSPSAIADARSADRLAMLNIERLVRDALFHHQQDRSAFLSPKDLTTIRRAQKLSAAGVATLELSPDEQAFIGKSKFRMWRRRGSLVLLAAGLVFLAIIVGLLAAPEDSDAVAATSEVDNALYGAYFSLIGDQKNDYVRKSVLAEESQINTERDASLLYDDHFWITLYAADAKVENLVEYAENKNEDVAAQDRQCHISSTRNAALGQVSRRSR